MKLENNLKWVTDVQTMDSYKLFLTFNDGWTVTWLDGTIDIAPEFLYERGVDA